MAVVPLPSSFKTLHADNNNQLVIICRATLPSTPPTKPNSSTFSQHRLKSLKTRPGTLAADQVLMREDDQLKIMKMENEAYWEEKAAIVIMRLKVAVERMREMEVQKFMRRVKGEMSENDGVEAEEMSKEIVLNLLERPVQYLISNNDNRHLKLEDKLRDVEILVAILENSCPANQR